MNRTAKLKNQWIWLVRGLVHDPDRGSCFAKAILFIHHLPTALLAFLPGPVATASSTAATTIGRVGGPASFQESGPVSYAHASATHLICGCIRRNSGQVSFPGGSCWLCQWWWQLEIGRRHNQHLRWLWLLGKNYFSLFFRFPLRQVFVFMLLLAVQKLHWY